jgi:hypothetical protein
MQKVRETLLKAQTELKKLTGQQMQASPSVNAIVVCVDAIAVAATVLPEFPAVSKKQLSLLAVGEKGDDDEEEEMDDDDDEDDANGAVESDGEHSAGQETDEEVEEEDEEMVAAANAAEAEASRVPASSAASPTLVHLPPSRSGSYGSSFLHAGHASPTQCVLDSYPRVLASPMLSTPQADALSPRLSVSPLPILAFSPFGREETMAFASQCRYSPMPA